MLTNFDEYKEYKDLQIVQTEIQFLQLNVILILCVISVFLNIYMGIKAGKKGGERVEKCNIVAMMIIEGLIGMIILKVAVN